MDSPTPAAEPVAKAPKARRFRLLRFLLIRLGIVALLVLSVRWTSLVESLMFYYPSRERFLTPRGYEDVSFTTSDGKTLHAWFIRAKDAAPGERRPAILHAHGNAGNINSHVDFSSFLAAAGFHAFIFDYRGYGRSDPARMLTRHELMTDTRAAFATLRARPDVDPARLGAYGVSLGGVFAAGIAAESPEVRALCTVSTFGTWNSIASDHLPVLGPLLTPTGLDPLAAMPRLAKRPYLIVHGDSDTIVPVAHARALESAARGAGVEVSTAIVSGADHNGIIAEHADARQAIVAFFSRYLGPAKP